MLTTRSTSTVTKTKYSAPIAHNGIHRGHVLPCIHLTKPRLICRAVRPSSSADSDDLSKYLLLLREKSSGLPQRQVGEVYLVGTGPGDPGLLTLRAYQMMQIADVVLYDRLVSDDILQLVSPSARMVYVGKQAGFHTRSQEEIHQLLLQFADAGARVVRLKGGDPFVFGRGGEEVQYLQAQGIRVHCVPGITAASGICAELGIPLTHRGTAASVRFLTGHMREGGEAELDETLVALGDDPYTTLVIYMGLGTLPALMAELRRNGMPADQPCVAVERGTTSDRRVVFSVLDQLQHRCSEAKLKSPTLLVIGKVVAFAAGWQDWLEHDMPLMSSDCVPVPNIEFTAPPTYPVPTTTHLQAVQRACEQGQLANANSC